MFGIGIVEIFIVFVLALIFIGPEKMPEAARALGRLVRQGQQLFAEIRGQVTADIKQDDPFVRPDFKDDERHF